MWTSEAGDFTPWLAENLDVLADELGMSLTLIAMEVPVGEARLDIQAQTPDGGVVIVENQLERTDHGHLGQLLVYASGLEAAAVVWVAPRFRDDHRRTLDWLNADPRHPELDQLPSGPWGYWALVVLLVGVGLPIQGSLVLTGSLLRFLPGADLVSGMHDLIDGALMSGAARLAEVVLLGAAIAGAASLVLSVGAHWDVRLRVPMISRS